MKYFFEAISYIASTKHAQEMYDPFVLKCFLEDECSWSFEEKQKVAKFYLLDKKYKVFCALHSNKKAGAKSLKQTFDENDAGCSKQSFFKLVDNLLRAMETESKEIHNRMEKRKKEQNNVQKTDPKKGKVQKLIKFLRG